MAAPRLGGAVAVPALEVEGLEFTTFSNASGAGQSFLEKKPPNEVVAEAWLGLASC